MSNNGLSMPFYGYNLLFTSYQQQPYCYFAFENREYPIQYNYFPMLMAQNQSFINHTDFKSYENPQTSLIQNTQIERSQQNQTESSSLQNKQRKNPKRNNKYQKEDRNLNSIVLRNFLNFIHGNHRIFNIIEGIIAKKNLKIQASEYLQTLRESLPPKQSYVGVGKVKKFIDSDREKNGLGVITLILLKKFIYENFFTVLVHSKKVSVKAREKELRHGKKFWDFFVRQVVQEKI